MTSFTRTFGGQTISPTSVSYATYTITANLALSWPFETPSTGNVLAWQNDISSASNLTVTLPNATLVSPGAACLINNTGTNTFTVLANGGLTVLGTVASGQQWYFYLSSNATAAGVWRAIQFGTGTSSASAASLAGAGLTAVVTRLNQQLLISPKPGNYSPVIGDLATVLRGTGGSVTWTPGSAATFGNGWFVYVINDGTGTLTWSPSGQTIDGAATKVFQPTESAIIFSDGANYWSLGYGRSSSIVVTGVNIPVTTGTVNLNSTQVAAQVQDISGTLTGNVTLVYGTGVGYWFVSNATTGSFSVTAKVNGGDTGVTVAQGTFSILRSNGTNMQVAFSGAVGTVTSVATTANLTGGPITTTGTLDLSSTGVSAATYGSGLSFPSIAVDIKGRITSATTVTIPTSSAAGLADATKLLTLDANGLVPAINGGFQPGDLVPSLTTSKPGWVFANATTIGNAASGASQRANADCLNLYTVLWNNGTFAVTGGRGVSAAADWAALKPIATPDLRGTVIAGADNMGGAASAGRLSSVFTSTTVGTGYGNNGFNTTSTGVSFTSTGTALTNGLGGTAFTNGLGGQIIGSSVSGLSFGGGGSASEAGDAIEVFGNAFIQVSGNASVTVSGGGTFGSAAFVIAQSTMVMNYWIKL